MTRCGTICGAVAVALLALIVSLMVASSPPGIAPPERPEGSTAFRPPWFVFKLVVRLNNFFEKMAAATRPPHVRVKTLATAYWQSEVTYSLTISGVIDAVGEIGPATCLGVAAQLKLHRSFLCRMMSAGEGLKLLNVDSHGYYSLTSAGELLQSSHPKSVRDFFLMNNEESRHAWRAGVTSSLKSGESGFKEHFGVEFWEWHDDPNNVGQKGQFDLAMKSLSKEMVGSLLLEWAPPKLDAVVCDLGGGVGHILVAIAQHYPQLGGILFDLPPVAKRAAANFAESGLDGRLKTMGGSFLEPLPAQLEQCDVFYTKFIMHDWPDEECVTILRNIAAVAKRGASFVTTDFILDLDGEVMETGKRLADINMLAAQPAGAQERTYDEFVSLFTGAGLMATPKLIRMRDVVTTMVVEL